MQRQAVNQTTTVLVQAEVTDHMIVAPIRTFFSRIVNVPEAVRGRGGTQASQFVCRIHTIQSMR